MRSDWVQRGAVSRDRVCPWANFFLRPPDDSRSSAFHPTESGPDGCSAVSNKRFLDNQPVAQSLVVALPVIQLISTTPILGSFEKSVIHGIRGTTVKCGCIPRS